jgi:hypothetical protein
MSGVMAENLLLLVRYLNVEDLEAIAGAVGVGPSGLLPRYRYYRDAARDRVYIGLLDYEVVIDKLGDLPFWPQAREALRKLKELKARHRCDTRAKSLVKSTME